MSKFSLIVTYFYIAMLLLFVIFTFSYVDLNLTLSSQRVVLNFVSGMQGLGYYHRDIATKIFVTFLIAFYSFYLYFLKLASRSKLSLGQLKKIILTVSILFIIAYPAFSYDIFNYMFDARILTHYHLSPYHFRALDFPNDDWVRFMHWVHRTSPYGPIWIGATLIPSFLGVGKFVLTLLLFKVLAIASYAGSASLIAKISQKVDPERTVLNVAFFALNPILLTEVLVSGHNDILMLFLGLVSFWFLIRRKNIKSLVFLTLSAGVKYVTAILAPILFGTIFFKRASWQSIFSYCTLALYLGLAVTLLGIFNRSATGNELQPWYFVWILGFVALSKKSLWVTLPTISFALGTQLRYLPFLLTGGWDPPADTVKFWVTLVPLTISLVIVFLNWIFKPKFFIFDGKNV